MTGRGALAIWHDIAPDAEAKVNHWYNRERHADRPGVTGFLSARRYVALSGSPKYFCLSATRELSVLQSPAYLERLNNPTEDSRRALPNYRNMNRTCCQEILRLGLGEGGIAGTWRMTARPGRADELAAWLRDEIVPQMASRDACVSALLLRGDEEVTGILSGEVRLRSGQDRSADVILVATANSPE